MGNTSLTGISFPFRVSGSGGIAMSTTSTTNISHIIEKIRIVLTTYIGDRTMEAGWCSQVDTLVFKDNDTSTHTLLEYHVENALRQLNTLISIVSVKAHGEDGYMYVDIVFKLIKYDRVYTVNNVKVGELLNE